MFWKWVTVIGLSMTPALILGQSAACAAGIGFGMNRWLLMLVVSVSSFTEGMIVTWLAGLSAKIPWLKRILARFHKPSAIAWCEKWGPWGGLFLGVAVVGIEPILVSLKWMSVDTKKIVLPLAASSVVFTVVYYYLVAFGYEQAGNADGVWSTFRELWEYVRE
ncbi:MAG TPA: hypothetical protein VL400_06440 [Polyangiaceae bacterium]|jgi:hypothetical protein|nr:hypothetical protein [Polyangiaceae bacterium]